MQRYRDTLILDAPIEAVFAFYTDVRNLARLVPPLVSMRVVRAQVPLKLGSQVEFAVRAGPMPFDIPWVARITEFDPNRTFADRQVRGPFERWMHRHEFRTLEDGRTEIVDTIEAGAARGFVGSLLGDLLLGQGIQTLFDHRRRVLREHFERAHTAHAGKSSPEPAPHRRS